jgi:hypothetical protein
MPLTTADASVMYVLYRVIARGEAASCFALRHPPGRRAGDCLRPLFRNDQSPPGVRAKVANIHKERFA